jgi:hypothetical protein
LWVHESERVFSDRLLEHDLSKFNEIITGITKTGFGENYKSVSNNGLLIFGSFSPVTVKIDGQDKKLVNKYCELRDMSALKTKC